jgi:hypothetical protein
VKSRWPPYTRTGVLEQGVLCEGSQPTHWTGVAGSLPLRTKSDSNCSHVNVRHSGVVQQCERRMMREWVVADTDANTSTTRESTYMYMGQTMEARAA